MPDNDTHRNTPIGHSCWPWQRFDDEGNIVLANSRDRYEPGRNGRKLKPDQS